MWEPGKLYDFDKPRTASLSTIRLCHQIIHSYMFLPTWEWNDRTKFGTLKSLLFVSERDRKSKLNEIDIDRLIACISEVGDEDIVEITMQRNKNGELWTTETRGVGRGDPRHWSSALET